MSTRIAWLEGTEIFVAAIEPTSLIFKPDDIFYTQIDTGERVRLNRRYFVMTIDN